MRKLLLFLFAPLIFALSLSRCASPTKSTPPDIDPTPAKAQYIKITPQEAHEMMFGDAIILDVRTQVEFDGGHIENALLLPNYDVEERAGDILKDKEQTILVYCQTGVRSQLAAKKLIDMGYTNVFDFGGINTWPGEIVGNLGYPSSYYYYFLGGQAPPDIVTSIDYTVTKRINDGMPEFDFRVEGENVKGYHLDFYRNKYYILCDENQIFKLTISSKDGTFKQEFSGLETMSHPRDDFGIAFDDWNFDGYLDVSLWKYPGGTMGNSPHYFWLWDNAAQKFVANEQLEKMSDYSWLQTDEETKQVVNRQRAGFGNYGTWYHIYKNGEFILVKFEEIWMEWVPDEDKYIKHVRIEELIGAKMTVTEE